MTRIGLRKQGTALKATLQIGKAGMTGSTISELEAQLEKRELVKVKLLSTGSDPGERKALFERLASATRSELIEVKGGTALFFKGKADRKR